MIPKLKIKLAVAGIGVATLLGTGCTAEDSQNPGGASADFDPVLTEMRTWQGCDVAKDLQPFADFMGIKRWTSTGTGKPDSVQPGEANMDPDAMICGAGIELDDVSENISGTGMLQVSVVPTPNEQLATASYDGRLKNTTDFHTKDENVGPWDQGILYAAEEETGSTSYVDVVARDGQWLFQIELSFTSDFGRRPGGGQPAYPFSNEELHQWLVETYLAETHAAIEKKLADAGVV